MTIFLINDCTIGVMPHCVPDDNTFQLIVLFIDEILHFVQDDNIVFVHRGGKQGRFLGIFVTCQILFETPLLPSLL
jgi:hypothetical protein